MKTFLEEAPSTLSIFFNPTHVIFTYHISRHLVCRNINGQDRLILLHKALPLRHFRTSSTSPSLIAVVMSQAFTGAADWTDYLHSAPPSTASVFADHYNSSADVIISTDQNPNSTNFTFNSALSGSSNPTTSRANRVTKPARKRSRASRRTPTTLLSTSTANFRAMVQQFTGGPSALGFGIGTAAIDHPQPRRLADQQARGVDGLGLMSSSPYANLWSGYSYDVQHDAPATEQAAYGGGGGGMSDRNAKSDGSSFLY